MKKIILVSTLLITSFVYSQTKTIAHKRHSGSKFNFSKSLHLEGLNGGTSNLGAAPERWIRNSQLKKVIFIDDSTQAMVTEETCTNEYSYQQREKQQWRAGTDTVKRHPVFSSDISVDSMRTILKADYYFANDMKDVKFVNFEQRQPKTEEQKEIRKEKVKSKVEKRKEKRSQKSGFGKYGWLLVVVVSSLGIGIINIR